MDDRVRRYGESTAVRDQAGCSTMSGLRIPRDLWSKAESLSALRIGELAWRPEDATQVLELLRPTEISVLGGDVYVKHFGRFEPGYESRHAECAPEEMLVRPL